MTQKEFEESMERILQPVKAYAESKVHDPKIMRRIDLLLKRSGYPWRLYETQPGGTEVKAIIDEINTVLGDWPYEIDVFWHFVLRKPVSSKTLDGSMFRNTGGKSAIGTRILWLSVKSMTECTIELPLIWPFGKDLRNHRKEVPKEASNKHFYPKSNRINSILNMKTQKGSSEYQRRKEQVREEAREWQFSFSEESSSWSEVAEAGQRFERLGRRYGLLREFRENGII